MTPHQRNRSLFRNILFMVLPFALTFAAALRAGLTFKVEVGL